MKSPARVLLAGVATLATFGALVGCSAGGETEGDSGKTELRVATFPPGADAAAYEAFAAQEAQFEDEHPDIDVIGVEYEWEGPTFAVQLAGGSLPDVFTVPFTDAKTLLENDQLMDVTEEMDELGYTDSFNPIILDAVTGDDGHIFGFPRQAYANALSYNRELFEAAGLDPDSPPTTWDEVREYAKQITDATGKAGYSQMAINNTGGWQLTTGTAARGGAHPDRQPGRLGRVDDRQRRHEGRAPVPARPEVGGQLVRLQGGPRLGHDQPGVRRRQHRHVHDGLRHLHRARPRLRSRPRRVRHGRHPGRGRTAVRSAAATSPS